MAGKQPLGRLRMGQIVNPTQTQRASIPSKFETILNTGTREKDGFSRRTHRFDDIENERPGPGFYHRPETCVKDPKGEYTSKRGTGGFASSEVRFYEAPRPLFVTPGPGRYDGNKDISASIPSSLHTGPKCTSSFAVPGPKRAVPKNTVNLPGPGHYDTPLDEARSNRPNATFKSTTKRNDMILGDRDVPGPGHYSDAILKHRSVTEVAAAVQERPAFVSNPLDPENPRPAPPVTAAVFRSNTDRDGKMLHKEEPPLDPKNLPPVPGMPPAPAAPLSPTKPKAVQQLGADGERIARPSSMFAPTTLDRFGRPTVKFSLLNNKTPGPGEYEGEEVPKKQLITSSWAMSGVERFPKGKNKRSYKPPGPAFYNPKDQGKQSFHANARTTWV